MNYYNEFDPGAAQWLRNLIAAKIIPDGVVDERDIRLVQPEELEKFQQCHFFAGIGGWPIALALAGWSQSEKVWTGSCPCQPFSVCGSRKGKEDDRHLWPEFLRLISKCNPTVVFGEQVASKDGREWLSGVRADLEGVGYAVGAADLCAASVQAPHIRQRLWWVADAAKPFFRRLPSAGHERRNGEDYRLPGRMADPAHPNGRSGERGEEEGARAGELGRRGPGERGAASGVAVSDERAGGEERSDPRGGRERGGAEGLDKRLGRSRPWNRFEIVNCADGKARRLEPGVPPLAHGVSGRVVKLRAYGNAIVPQVAAEFVTAYLEARQSY